MESKQTLDIVAWIVTGIAVIFTVLLTNTAEPLWAMVIPAVFSIFRRF